MAAGLGFIEFNTGDILTAASANGYLASQTVMVFASAAARTSAIASPQEGMVSYLKDTDAVEKYNGTAWVGIAAASASGLTFIQKGSFSASASVNVNTCFSSTYDNYRILIKAVNPSPVNAQLRYRMRSGSTDASGANYNFQRFFAQNSSTGAAASTAQTSGQLASVNTGVQVISLDMFNPFLAASTGFNEAGLYDGKQMECFTGLHDVATSYDGFTIFPDSGTLTGEVWVYGYAK
jgi:hypothetical protein